MYIYYIKLQVICLELSTHFPKEVHYKWEWKCYVSNQPTRVYLTFLSSTKSTKLSGVMGGERGGVVGTGREIFLPFYRSDLDEI